MIGLWVATAPGQKLDGRFAFYIIVSVLNIGLIALAAQLLLIVRKNLRPSDPSGFREIMRHPVIVSVSLAALECVLIATKLLPKPSFLLNSLEMIR